MVDDNPIVRHDWRNQPGSANREIVSSEPVAPVRGSRMDPSIGQSIPRHFEDHVATLGEPEKDVIFWEIVEAV